MIPLPSQFVPQVPADFIGPAGEIVAVPWEQFAKMIQEQDGGEQE
jgi:hypothetical protein